MESLNIIPDLEEKGFRDGRYPVEEFKGQISIGGLGEGTLSGKPTVMIGFDLGEQVLVAQTTLALFLSAADALKAKYIATQEYSVSFFENQDLTGNSISIHTWAETPELAAEFAGRQMAWLHEKGAPKMYADDPVVILSSRWG